MKRPERGRHGDTPVITFVGMSGTGKTTYIERLIPHLKDRGLRLAVVKHDGHRFEMDRSGKDTWRFGQAGADVVAISCGGQAAILERPEGELTLDELISRLPPADLILTEGYKSEENAKIELHRRELGRPLISPPEQLLAVITDEPLPVQVPQLSFDDLEDCVAKILRFCQQYNQ